MSARLQNWPDTTQLQPPIYHFYRSATWLLGRHPRLARLIARIAGVVEIDDGELTIDLDHLAGVIAAVPTYLDAWRAYENSHRAPDDDDAWYRWHDAGPNADSFAVGLSNFLVMSTGEAATLRLLALFANERIPFHVSDLRSMDDEGHRLLIDWIGAVTAVYGMSSAPIATARFIERSTATNIQHMQPGNSSGPSL